MSATHFCKLPHNCRLTDNVYIGCGAKVIGANCVIVKDVPTNSTTVIRCIESIVSDVELDNEWICNS